MRQWLLSRITLLETPQRVNLGDDDAELHQALQERRVVHDLLVLA